MYLEFLRREDTDTLLYSTKEKALKSCSLAMVNEGIDRFITGIDRINRDHRAFSATVFTSSSLLRLAHLLPFCTIQQTVQVCMYVRSTTTMIE